MGGSGSIPYGVLLVILAFAALMLIEFCSLGLVSKTPRNKKPKKGKVVRMNDVRKVLSVGFDTAWAVGCSIVAGLPLLT